MSEKPIVTVIMPTFRQHQYLLTSIKSIMAQTYSNVELLLVMVQDDKETWNALESVRYDLGIVVSEKANHIHQINLGLEKAKGKFITLFASDDFMLPNKIDAEMSVASAKNAVLVYSRFFISDENFNIYLMPNIPEFSYERLLSRCFVGDNSLVARRMYDEFGKFEESLGSLAVYDKWLHIAEKYEDCIVYNPVPTFIYRFHPKQQHTPRLADPKQMELYEKVVKASRQRKGLPTDAVKFRVRQIPYERV